MLLCDPQRFEVVAPLRHQFDALEQIFVTGVETPSDIETSYMTWESNEMFRLEGHPERIYLDDSVQFIPADGVALSQRS